MSGALREITNSDGVILRYAPAVRARHHDEQRRWPSDRLRMALMRAERELTNIETMRECREDEMSDVAIDLHAFAIRTISAALSMAREELAK
jgi:hypothetical protein